MVTREFSRSHRLSVTETTRNKAQHWRTRKQYSIHKYNVGYPIVGEPASLLRTECVRSAPLGTPRTASRIRGSRLLKACLQEHALCLRRPHLFKSRHPTWCFRPSRGRSCRTRAELFVRPHRHTGGGEPARKAAIESRRRPPPPPPPRYFQGSSP